jgi:hypothetical protein
MIITMLLPCKVGAASGVGVGFPQAELPKTTKTIISSKNNFFIASPYSIMLLAGATSPFSS